MISLLSESLGLEHPKKKCDLAAFCGGWTAKEVERLIADRYAYVKASLWTNGHPIPENDVWIAATALETGSRLLSRDAHFDHVGGLVKIS